MKFEINIGWSWVLHKVRLAFLVGIFYILYVYVAPVWAFMWIAYFILNDLWEIVLDLETLREEKTQIWKNISHRRKDF